VSLAGRLEEVAFPEVLNLISWGKKTGKLELSKPDAEGIVVFRRGNIIYAASNRVREVLGNILLCRKLITEDNLISALARQHRSGEERRLGTILVEMGVISQSTLEEIVCEQTTRVLTEFFQWRTGFFRFITMEIPERGEVEVDAQNLLLEQGMRTEAVVLEVAETLDAEGGDSSERGHERLKDPFAPADSSSQAASPASATLGTLLADVDTPGLSGELTLKILRAAAGVVGRAVLVIPDSDGFVGVAQSGITLAGESADARVRKLLIPYQGPSLFADVLSSRTSFRGRLARTHWNNYLLRELGGLSPNEVIAMPVVAQDRVFAILYGDNAPGAKLIGATANLEVALRDVALTLARAGWRPNR
jgi:hypothetical protein